MRILIIEDEHHAADLLAKKIAEIRPECQVAEVLDTVKSSLNWLSQNPSDVDLIFMDIELADGSSFEIFKHLELPAPVIFVTAYNQYAIDAFKVNAVDYLLKPIANEDLEASIRRWEVRKADEVSDIRNQIDQLTRHFKPKAKNRCLVKRGNSFEFINVEEIALAYSEESITFLVTFDGKRHLYSRTIEQLHEELDASRFYQINRGQLVNIENIIQVHPYLGQRLKLTARTMGQVDELLVSRNRASDFKSWLDS